MWPTVSENLARLAAFLRTYFGQLRMIDVGANIGDSYCLAGGQGCDTYLLIEGDPHYFDLLSRNVPSSGSILKIQTLLAEKPSISKGKLIAEKGTARVIHHDKGAWDVEYQTLDGIIGLHPSFNSGNFLKTDVDGFDSKVLIGGLEFISRMCPVIFFEHHPRLLAACGEDDTYIFRKIAELGYSRLILYDIQGFLLGKIQSDDHESIEDLVRYAKCRDDYCYDVCCFHDKDAGGRDEFLDQERSFYAALKTSRL